MTFHYANVVTSIWSTATVNDYGYQVIESIWIDSVVRLKFKIMFLNLIVSVVSWMQRLKFGWSKDTYCIEETKLKGKYDTMWNLNMPIILFNIFETF